MKKFAVFIILLCPLYFVPQVRAAQVRAYVAEFNVAGVPNRDELKGTLQTLLASRLSTEAISVVDTAGAADVLVTGSYAVMGKMFSLDAVAKDSSGKVLTRMFEQGEGQDELIPALNRLAQKLGGEIAKTSFTPAAKPVSPAPASPVPVPPVVAAPSGEIVRAETVTQSGGSSWTSQRLDGALVGIAPGRTLEDGERELYVVDKHALRLYLQGKELKLIAEVAFGNSDTILGVDTADLDGDGVPEAYLTMLRDDNLASQVWVARDGALQKIAENLPYFFRAIALDGKGKRLYAQAMGLDVDFYGDVQELVKKGSKFETQNPIKLPRFGCLYNFNRFSDTKGNSYFVVINDDGYIIVYSAAGEELWRSSDKFGGTELYFKRQDMAKMRTTGDQYRWRFLQQRIVVTPQGEIIIPKNSGLFVFGNNRSYKKNTVFAFVWNGSTLDEKWHTKESQNYLADYSYDAPRKELILLEVVKKEGLVGKGASAVVVKRVE